MSKLYIVATPIGNLKDITYHAVEILRDNVDIIFCESTLNSKRLFDTYNIHKPTSTFNVTSSDKSLAKIAEYLEEGKNVAYISDAGTPGISDPGPEIVRYVRNTMPEVEIVPIGGISAFTTLVSVSGISISHDNPIVFYGFVPHKKGRETLIKKIAAEPSVHVMYESVHRFEKFLEQIEKIFAESGVEKKIIVGRELTKMFEEVKSGTISEVKSYFKSNKDKLRGEFVIIIE